MSKYVALNHEETIWHCQIRRNVGNLDFRLVKTTDRQEVIWRYWSGQVKCIDYKHTD